MKGDRRFTLRSKWGGMLPVLVRIFISDESWERGAKRHYFDPESAGCCGSVNGIDLFGKQYCKEVHVNLKADHVGAGYIAHEMVHAGMVLRKAVKKRDEETLAYVVGDLVAMFWDKMYKLEALHIRNNTTQQSQ